MARPYHAEVTAINGDDSVFAKSFSNRDHRGVDEAKGHVSVLPAELPTTTVIGNTEFQDGECAVFNVSEAGVG